MKKRKDYAYKRKNRWFRAYVKTKKWAIKTIYQIKTLSFLKHILIFYVLITVLGTVLLILPVSQNPGVNISFVDALFTSASAFSDTGLVSVGTTNWSFFGQAVIAILILVGGIGWFALKVYIFNVLLGRPLSYATRDALSAERGSAKVGYSKDIIKISITFLFVALFVSTFILSALFFYLEPSVDPFNVRSLGMSDLLDDNMISKANNPYGNYLNALRFGFFHSISALNNAGFDIIGNNSVAPYYHIYGVQIMFILLFVAGGIGYPVFYDTYKWIQAKRNNQNYRWSLFTKLSVTVYFLVTLFGLILTFSIELSANDYPILDALGNKSNTIYTFWNNPMYGTSSNKVMALIFNSMSTRNAGFSTVRYGDFTPVTAFVFIILMFIGSAPSSTAGGIRTTTFGIIMIGIWGKIRGKDQVSVFKTKISSDLVTRSYIVVASSIALVILGFLLCFSSFAEFGGKINSSARDMFMVNSTNGFTHVNYNYIQLLFEVSSAFGTTGLSVGITSNLSILSKITIIIVMFMGQLGISSSLSIWQSKNPKFKHYDYMEEDLVIG